MYRSALIVLLVAFSSFRFATSVNADKLVMKAAEDQLAVYLAKIPQGHEKDYGFKNEDNMDNCKVGKPYRMLVFNIDFYNAKTLDESANYLSIQNEWRVPVMINNEHRALLTVTGSPSNLTVTGLGAAVLAKDLQEKSLGASDTDTWYILRIFPLSADFLVVEHDNSIIEAQLIPLESAKDAIPALHKLNKPFYNISEVQSMVKEAVANKQVVKEPAKKPAKKAKAKK
jgi:hypothetical protein